MFSGNSSRTRSQSPVNKPEIKKKDDKISIMIKFKPSKNDYCHYGHRLVINEKLRLERQLTT